jgi:uncharacterized protein (TIGR00251 family)
MLEVRVQTKASRNRVEVGEGRKLRVYVTSPPESGKANEAVVSLLSKKLGVAKSGIVIVRGLRARDKLVRIEGMTPDEALKRLSARQ